MADQLESDKVLKTLYKVLPEDCNTLNSPHVALAALVHALHVQLEFRLTPSHAVSDTLEDEEDKRLAANRLPDGWGQPGRDLSLAYRHASSAMSFETGVSKVGGRVIVNAVAVEDSKTKTLDVVITDYFSSSVFPFTVSADASFVEMFASPARLKDLISLWKSGIVQPLMPGLLKGESTTQEEEQAPPRQTRGSYYPDPGGPFVGGRPEFPQAGPSGLRIPNVGGSDLDPLAGLGGSTGGRIPLGGIGGDGMMVGPNHPLFRDRLRDPGADQQRFWTGDGYLPPGAVPPGARFDPVGPNGPPGFGQGPDLGMPGRGRGGPGRNFGDAMRPPGFNPHDMFG